MADDKEVGAEPAVSTLVATDDRLTRAVQATYIAFVMSGFAFANWAARIPQVRQHFQLQPSTLGLVLLAIAAGSIVALPLSGPVIAWLGPRRAVSICAVLLSIGLAIVAIGYLVGLATVVTGLFVFGLANGAWDVAMNIHGGAVERHLGRSIMPRFHAGWSIGSVAGAIVGAVAVAVHLPVTVHLAVVAVLVVLVVPRATRNFLPSADQPEGLGQPEGVDQPEADGQPEGNGAPSPEGRPRQERPAHRRVLRAWLEPRTLAIGAFVLAFALAEGTANDWSSLAAIDGYHVPAAVGTLVFATFLAAMTAGRWFSPAFLDRYGRVPVARLFCLVAIAGVVLFVFGPVVPFAFVGALLWGAGTSVGFPLGMSAGGDEPDLAAGRVSVIASIGYCAFLAGPPLIGFLGDQLTVQHALTSVAVLLALALPLAPVVRPPKGTQQGHPRK